MTRVRSVRFELLELPFRVPVTTGRTTWRSRRLALVRIAADEIEGLGEIASERPGGLAEPLPDRLLDGILDGLSEIDPEDEEALGRWLDGLAFGHPDRRPIRAGVEAAILDLLGRSDGRSVRDGLAAGGRASVAVNGLVAAARPDDAAREARPLVSAGIRCVKVKVGLEFGVDDLVARVAAVREAVGPGVGLRLDANGAWPVDDAIARLRALAGFDLEYVEQPISEALGPRELARVRRAVPVRVAADEAVTDVGAVEGLLRAQAVDALIVKPARVGGLRPARQIVERAAEDGVPVVVSTLFETGVGLAAALHLAATVPGVDRAHGLATADLLASDLLADGPRVVAGRIAVPDRPGLGIRLDEAAVARFSGPA